MDSETTSILSNAATSAEALKGLYRRLNANGSRLTMVQIAKILGFASSGHVSDILNGKRILKPALRANICKVFGLAGESSRCLQLLVLMDNEVDPQKKAKLVRRLSLVRKALKIVKSSAPPVRRPEELQRLFFALEVFCAFGLFRNGPTQLELIGYFGEDKRQQVREALAMLENLKLAKCNEGRYQALAKHWLVEDDAEGISHLDFIKLALSHAAANVATWFDRPQEAAYISTIISTNDKKLKRLMPRMKSKLLLMQADLESSKAEMLVRFNVQIYPVV